MAVRVLVMPSWYPWSDTPCYGLFCQDQARAAATCHDVVVSTWRRDPSLRVPYALAESEENGLPTFRLRFRPEAGSVAKILGIMAMLGRLRSRHWSPDVIHAHVYGAGRTALVAARVTSAPVILSEHASDVARGTLSPKHLADARRIYGKVAVVAPVSKDLGGRIAPLVGNTPVVPVPNAVDTWVFRPGRPLGWRHTIPSRSLRLLAVGNLVDVKGHRFLIEAMKILWSSGVDVTLDIIGDGELRSQLQRQAAASDSGTRINFHGALPRAGVADHMRAADIFVLPSLWETMGCVLAEAMASGTPAVASNVGGTPETLDVNAGLLVPPASAAALAEGVMTMARSLDRYDPRAVRQLAVARFSYQAIAARWTSVYDQVLSDTGRRTAR